MPSVSLGTAFLGGFLSFLSPCYLPLIPSYMGYLAGSNGPGGRRLLLRNTAAFIVGFGLVFTLLGLSSSAFGSLLLRYQHPLRYAGGAFIMLMGLQQIGLLRMESLQRQWRIALPGSVRSWPDALLAGAAFGFGWTPCIGPTLGAILVYAGTTETAASGATLLLAFSLGLGVPFFISALAVDRLSGFSRRMGAYLPWIERLGGLMLILLGLAIAMNWLSRLSAYFWFTL